MNYGAKSVVKKGCTREAMRDAAENGYLDVVEWLHRHDPKGCTAEAKRGSAECWHLAMVDWLHKNIPEWCNVKTISGAKKERLKVLPRLHFHHSEGCATESLGDRATENEQWDQNCSKSCTTGKVNKEAESGDMHETSSSVNCPVTVAKDESGEKKHVAIIDGLKNCRLMGCAISALVVSFGFIMMKRNKA